MGGQCIGDVGVYCTWDEVHGGQCTLGMLEMLDSAHGETMYMGG